MQPSAYPRGGFPEVKHFIGLLLGLSLLQFALLGYLMGGTALLNDRVALVEIKPNWVAAQPYAHAWTTFLDVTVQYGEGELSREEARGRVAPVVKFDPELALAWETSNSAFVAMLERALWGALLDE